MIQLMIVVQTGLRSDGRPGRPPAPAFALTSVAPGAAHPRSHAKQRHMDNRTDIKFISPRPLDSFSDMAPSLAAGCRFVNPDLNVYAIRSRISILINLFIIVRLSPARPSNE